MFSLIYIDDEPDLLELGKLFLESTGDFTVTTALSGNEGLSRLAHQGFDAIVSDYQMPEMNGIDFLKNVRKSYGTIPFILFTGRGREEVVIEAINNGADFYLQKGGDPEAQFAELAHKLRQAVTRRKAQEELRAAYEQISAAEEELRDQYDELARNERDLRKSASEISGLFQAAPVGIAVVADRVLQRINERLCTMTGYPRNELEGRNTRFLYLNDIDYGAVGRMREQAYREGAPDSIDIQWIRKDGIVIDVHISAAPTDRSDPNAPMIYSALDVTEKKREHSELLEAYGRVSAAEVELKSRYDELARSEQRTRESEASIAGILRAAPVGIGLVSNRILLRVNDRVCEITGYSRDELIGQNVRILYPDDDEYIRAGKFYTLSSSGVIDSMETRFLRKDGTIRDIQIYGTAIDPSDPAAGMIFTALDITEGKRARG